MLEEGSVKEEGTEQEGDVIADAPNQDNQIGDMLDMFVTGNSSKEGIDEKAKTVPEKEEPAADDKSTTTPAKKDTADAKDDVVTLKEELELLRGEIAELRKPKEAVKVTTEEDEMAENIESVKKSLVSDFIVDDEEYDAIVDDRGKMNTLLGKVQSTTVEAVLRSIPNVLDKMIAERVRLFTKTSDFYRAHPDLAAHGKIVGQVIDDIASKNPALSLDEVLLQAGGDGKGNLGEVRRRLGLKTKAQDAVKKEQETVRKPVNSAVRTAHVRQPADIIQLTGIEKEIQEMLDLDK